MKVVCPCVCLSVCLSVRLPLSFHRILPEWLWEWNENLIELYFSFFLGKINACGKKPCKNHGTCQTGFTNKGYRCVCSPEFKGHDCTEGKTVYVMAPSVNLSSKETTSKCPKLCMSVNIIKLLFWYHQWIIKAWGHQVSYSDIDCYFLDLTQLVELFPRFYQPYIR